MGTLLAASTVPNVAPPDVRQLRRLWRGQVIVALAAVALVAPFGVAVLASVALGAATCVLATRLFSKSVFVSYRAQRPDEILRRFYGAEAARLLVMPAVLAAALALLDALNPLALLGAFFIVQTLPALFATRSPARAPAQKS